MWNLKCTIIPVIIWATAIVTRSLSADKQILCPFYHTFTTTLSLSLSNKLSGFISLRLCDSNIFNEVGSTAPRPTHNLEDQDIPLIWVIIIDLSKMGGLTSSCATGGICLRIPWPWKPQHCVEVWIASARSFPFSRPMIFICPSSTQ